MTPIYDIEHKRTPTFLTLHSATEITPVYDMQHKRTLKFPTVHSAIKMTPSYDMQHKTTPTFRRDKTGNERHGVLDNG